MRKQNRKVSLQRAMEDFPFQPRELSSGAPKTHAAEHC
jgi:hypothetical protein